MVKGSGSGRRGKKPHGNPPNYQFDTRALMKALVNERKQNMGREPQTEREDATAEGHDEFTQDWNDAVERDRREGK
jgi:hypothetical protein